MYIIVATISITVKTMINIVSALIISNFVVSPIITLRNEMLWSTAASLQKKIRLLPLFLSLQCKVLNVCVVTFLCKKMS